MLGAIREVQIPLLAAMLLGGCGAKALRVLRARDMAVGLGPTALFPLRLHRPVAVSLCVTEMALGIGLVLTSTRFAGSPVAAVIRAGTALLFLIAVGSLVELRERRPDAGCGCFGELSSTPVGMRTIVRCAVLALAALSTIGQPGLHMPTSGSAAGQRLGILAAELLLIAALSPEIGEAMVRLGYSEPCEVRRLSVHRTLSSLTGSTVWRRHVRLITSAAPSDIWREGCWRYVVYPGEAEGRDLDLVFAVYLRARRPQIRAAVMDSITGEVIAGPGVPTWEPGDDAGHGWPVPEPAPSAMGRGVRPGLAAMRPGRPAHPIRPVSPVGPGSALGRGTLTRAGGPAGPAPGTPVSPAARLSQDRAGQPGDALVTGGAGALHFAAPVYTRNGHAHPRNGQAFPPDGADPAAYAVRRAGGPVQRTDFGRAGRKPEGRSRTGSRPARHRSSATF